MILTKNIFLIMDSAHLKTCVFHDKEDPVCQIQGCSATVIDLSCPREVNSFIIGFCSRHWWEHCDEVIWDPFLSRCVNSRCDACKINLTARQNYDTDFLVRKIESMENSSEAPNARRKLEF